MCLWIRGGMESKEIKSLASSEWPPLPEPAREGMSESFRRKKLAMHFAESDERLAVLGIGRQHWAGTTPVDIRGRPIEDLSKTGGWIAAFFIFG